MNTAIQQPFKLLEKPQAAQLPTIGTNVLELDTERFKKDLNQRIDNREILLSSIQERLIKGKDFYTIKVWDSNQRRKIDSKPALSKSGAEKVCGMLALTVNYPNLDRYEDMIIDGKEIKDIVIKCQLISASGDIVASGIGARNYLQDWVRENKNTGLPAYRDINKALKMALKSAHIDAALRAGGLSEIFTQDEESIINDERTEPQRAAKKVVTEKQVIHIPKAVIAKKKETIGKMPFEFTGDEKVDTEKSTKCLTEEFDKLPEQEQSKFTGWMKNQNWATFAAVPKERFLSTLNILRRGITQSKISSIKQALPYCDDSNRRLEEEMRLKELTIELDILNGKL